jgi:hypothetical protein
MAIIDLIKRITGRERLDMHNEILRLNTAVDNRDLIISGLRVKLTDCRNRLASMELKKSCTACIHQTNIDMYIDRNGGVCPNCKRNLLEGGE